MLLKTAFHQHLSFQNWYNFSEETLEFSFETTATTFESLFASKGYSLSFDYTSSSNINGNYTFVYSFEISDGYMNISLNQTASF